jgi:hypothetical protein
MALFADGKVEEAVFWLNAGRLRTQYDAFRCADLLARNTSLRDMEAQVPEDLLRAELDRPALHERVIQEVLDWDETTPYFYDHRWIYQHGSGAYMAIMGPEQAEEAGFEEIRDPDAEPGAHSLPKSRWPELYQAAREQFRAMLEATSLQLPDDALVKGTACTGQLLHDVLQLLSVLERSRGRDLPPVIKAECVEFSKKPVFFGTGMIGGAWKERWELACPGQPLVYEIQLQPDPSGAGTHFRLQRASESDEGKG